MALNPGSPTTSQHVNKLPKETLTHKPNTLHGASSLGQNPKPEALYIPKQAQTLNPEPGFRV